MLSAPPTSQCSSSPSIKTQIPSLCHTQENLQLDAPHFFFNMPSFFVNLFFVLALAEFSSLSALSSGRARGDRRGLGLLRSGSTLKGNQKTSADVEPAVGESWGTFGMDAAFRSVHSEEEGGVWEPRISSRCVPIPSNMALCQNIGYENMRMPNLLGHESPAEAVQQSVSWLTLLARECHPDARIFLCSLFAPICLDR